MDQSHHVLVSPFTLSDYNDKVGYKGAHIHKQKDYLSYCEVSSIFFFNLLNRVLSVSVAVLRNFSLSCNLGHFSGL
jgi:hypothetical protein